jgi:hypothetical protein
LRKPLIVCKNCDYNINSWANWNFPVSKIVPALAESSDLPRDIQLYTDRREQSISVFFRNTSSRRLKVISLFSTDLCIDTLNLFESLALFMCMYMYFKVIKQFIVCTWEKINSIFLSKNLVTRVAGADYLSSWLELKAMTRGGYYKQRRSPEKFKTCVVVFYKIQYLWSAIWSGLKLRN